MDGTERLDSRAYRRALAETLRADGHLRSARIAEAIEAVPRELFVPGVPLDEVYRPREAIVTKRIDGVSVSSASAPEVVALMLEQLDPQPGDHVLEIGAGTGYNAALLAHLVGSRGSVVTLDIDEDLVLGAREQLARPSGRLVMPLAMRGLQRCVVFTPEDDYLVCRAPRGCSFIGLRGLLAAGVQRVPLDPHGAHVVSGADETLMLSAEEVAALLRAPAHILPSGVATTFEQLREGLHLWFAAHQPGMCTLWGGAQVPDLFGLQDSLRGTLCLMDSTSMVLLAWADEARREGELVVLAPAGAEALAEVALNILQDWDGRGRPMDAAAVIR